jgi:molybdate transport system ATP-binding protein
MFLKVENLSVVLGKFKLKNINLKLEKNDYMVVIGPTGSGKSILLETIAGFYSPKSGRIFLEGKDITQENPENRGISIVYQDYVLFPNMNVFENIAYGLKKRIKDKNEIESKVLKIAKDLKISDLLDRNTETLSGGEKQRTAIARSLIVEPNILLMDEPFSALDVNTHAYLTDLIKNAISDYKTTCIHVSHNFNDVWSLAEQVAVMKDGEILQQGIVTDVFSKPCHNFVADFVGVHNIFEGEVLSKNKGITKVKINPDLVLHSSDTFPEDEKKVTIAIRPENIIFSNETFVSSLRNQLKGIVKEIIQIGPTVWIEAEVTNTKFKGIITPSSADLLEIKKGKEIYLSFKSVNVKIINENESFASLLQD